MHGSQLPWSYLSCYYCRISFHLSYCLYCTHTHTHLKRLFQTFYNQTKLTVYCTCIRILNDFQLLSHGTDYRLNIRRVCIREQKKHFTACFYTINGTLYLQFILIFIYFLYVPVELLFRLRHSGLKTNDNGTIFRMYRNASITHNSRATTSNAFAPGDKERVEKDTHLNNTQV